MRISDWSSDVCSSDLGRLTVAGDLDFAAGSVYEVEVNASGEGDRLDATGTVTIDAGASVAVLAEAGDYAPRTDYVSLTGAGVVRGSLVGTEGRREGGTGSCTWRDR